MNKVKTAVVLAGGAGTRLYPLTNSRPKPMIKLLGKPILQWVIEWLKYNGIANLILGVAYHKEAVTNYFKDGSPFGVKISYSVHSVEGETGEGFRLAIERFVNDDLFLALNGDEIANYNIHDLVENHLRHKPVATIAVTNPRSPFGVITTDKNGLVSKFSEKPLIKSLLVSVGSYVFDKRITEFLPETGSIERTTFVSLAKQKLLRAYPISGEWLTVNTLKDLKYAESILGQRVREKTWLGL